MATGSASRSACQRHMLAGSAAPRGVNAGARTARSKRWLAVEPGSFIPVDVDSTTTLSSASIKLWAASC